MWSTFLGTVTPRAASAKDPELDRVEEEEEGGEDGEREEEKEREEEEKARRAKEDLNSLSDLDELLFCRSVNQVKVGNVWLLLTDPGMCLIKMIRAFNISFFASPDNYGGQWSLNFIVSGNVERI